MPKPSEHLQPKPLFPLHKFCAEWVFPFSNRHCRCRADRHGLKKSCATVLWRRRLLKPYYFGHWTDRRWPIPESVVIFCHLSKLRSAKPGIKLGVFDGRVAENLPALYQLFFCWLLSIFLSSFFFLFYLQIFQPKF